MECKNVKQIIIKSQSGYVSEEHRYEDTMILEKTSLHYHFSPVTQNYGNEEYEWSFKTSSREFQFSFDSLASDIVSLIEQSKNTIGILDSGTTFFSVTYEGGTKEEYEYQLGPSYLSMHLSYIRDLIPMGERIPEMLKTYKDYCEEKNFVDSTIEKLFSDDEALYFEGCTQNGKPCGAGTAYYPDGTVYQEGIFDVKGFLYGREYYPSGELRFEGTYKINNGYGPNYPVYGSYYDEDGNHVFTGLFKVKRTGLGYPIVTEPEAYGPVVQASAPHISPFMWEDLSKES